MISDNLAELFVVVDKNDNILDFRTRADCHKDKSLIHRAVSVVIFDDQGRMLLQRRSQTKDLQPGLWELSIGGHVEKDETYAQAAKRELKEELDVDLSVKLIDKFLMKDETETEMLALFTAKHNGPFKFNQQEIAESKFFSTQELKEKVDKGDIILTTWAKQVLLKLDISN